HYYSMHYVEGQSLADILSQGRLSGTQAAIYLRAVAAAVHHAHMHGILHRDLKPTNILIDATSGRPYVADFGLAKRLLADRKLTPSGAALGTLGYTAPEQMWSANAATAASDVYSLGATLYEVLTGCPPSRRGPFGAVISPRKFNTAVNRHLETICLKCLEWEPAWRYRTAALLADRLQDYLDGKPCKDRPVTILGRLYRWVLRKPAQAAVVGLTILMAGLMIGL